VSSRRDAVITILAPASLALPPIDLEADAYLGGVAEGSGTPVLTGTEVVPGTTDVGTWVRDASASSP
jgi:hypothetical protein